MLIGRRGGSNRPLLNNLKNLRGKSYSQLLLIGEDGCLHYILPVYTVSIPRESPLECKTRSTKSLFIPSQHDYGKEIVVQKSCTFIRSFEFVAERVKNFE